MAEQYNLGNKRIRNSTGNKHTEKLYSTGNTFSDYMVQKDRKG